MPSPPKAPDGVRVSKLDLLWVTLGGAIPVLIAVFNYNRNPTNTAQFVVSAALVLGSFTLIVTRVRALERSLDQFFDSSKTRNSAVDELASAALAGDDMSECRKLISVYKRILQFDNPLMSALARAQFSSLAGFLAKFDEGLPFFPKHELITIDKHYLSFMRRMGRLGTYDATTFVQFWYDQEEDVLREFRHNNEVAANDGVRIRRVFLLNTDDERDGRTNEVLRRHAAMTREGYQHGGAIATRVLVSDAFSRNHDDFGIYILDGAPKAIAIANFGSAADKLQGNVVSFDEDLMRKKHQLFEDRWHKAVDLITHLERQQGKSLGPAPSG